MRQCLELGLHKQRVVEDQQIPFDQIRKRLFWSVYIFERKTALVVGRPFAVSDKEIDTEIPLNVNDDEEDIVSLSAAKSEQSTGAGVSNRRSTLSLHRHHILLYHIHTRIRFTLRHLKKAGSPRALEKKIAKRFQELEQWKENILREYSCNVSATRPDITSKESDNRDSSSDSDSDRTLHFKRSVETERTELLLEYHKARRSLLQPLMTEAHDHYSFGLSDYLACADSSGQICQLYRRLHRLSPVPFTLRDLHAVFVAGVTLIYSICANSALYDAQRAGDIGACSTVLYVITEQWPSARKYRDSFETVAERLVERTRKTGKPDVHVCRPQIEIEGTEESISQPSQPHISHKFPGSQLNMARGTEHAARRSGSSLRYAEHVTETSNPINSAFHTRNSIDDIHDHSGTEYGEESSLQNGQVSTETLRPAMEKADSPNVISTTHESDMSIGLDLDFGFDGIGGLLTNEGMDWFTEAVLWG